VIVHGSGAWLSTRRRSRAVLYLIRSKGFLRFVCSLCFLTVLGVDPLWAAGPAADTEPPTNFEIIGKISAETAGEIVSAIGALGQGDLVLVTKAKSGGSADFLLENAFVEKMHAAGLRIAIDAGSKDPAVASAARYRLSYQVIRLNISYPDVSRTWLIGPRKVERLALADVFVQFIDLSTGDILWVRETHKRYDDTIGYGDLKSVEDAQYDFTKPPHSGFKMSRLLEPVVVGGIVVGLIYLFFSNQSNK
jgi:hypothetical protein